MLDSGVAYIKSNAKSRAITGTLFSFCFFHRFERKFYLNSNKEKNLGRYAVPSPGSTLFPNIKFMIMKKMTPIFRTYFLPALLLILVTSCKKEIRNENAEAIMSERELATSANKSAAPAASPGSQMLQAVRRATARFHSTAQAIAAGYEPDDHCVSVPGLGGMGFHWVNPSLVDPVFDPLKPEAILYAPGPGGNLRLVAVEYIVINVGQPAPMFGDQPFDVGGTPVPAPHWSLHAWVHESNPSGIFAPFNPNVSCQ